jgi:hypothetical protein
MNKQGPVVSETPVSEEAASSTQDTPASDSSSYYTGMGGGKLGFISFQGGSYQNKSVESVPHPGKEASRLVWFVGPTILVSFLVLPSLYLRKVLSAVFEDSLLTGMLSLIFGLQIMDVSIILRTFFALVFISYRLVVVNLDLCIS